MSEKPKEPINIVNIIRALYPIGVILVLQVLVGFVFGFYVLANNPEAASDQKLFSKLLTEQSLLMTLFADGVSIPFLVFLMYVDKKRVENKGFKKVVEGENYLKYILILPYTLFALLVSNVAATIIISGLPESFVRTYDNAAEIIYKSDKLTMIVAVVFAGPIFEELLFRGVIYNRVKDMSNNIAGIIISAVVFGIFHMNWVQGIFAGIFGVFLALVYYKYKSILASIIMHMANNGFSLFLTFKTKDGLENASKGTQKEAFDPVMVVQLAIFGAILYGVIKLIDHMVKTKVYYVAVQAQNPYGKYSELNNGYNDLNNGYNDLNNYNNANNYNGTNNYNGVNNYNGGYNQNYNGYNQDYSNANQMIDNYLASQGNLNNNENNGNENS